MENKPIITKVEDLPPDQEIKVTIGELQRLKNESWNKAVQECQDGVDRLIRKHFPIQSSMKFYMIDTTEVINEL